MTNKIEDDMIAMLDAKRRRERRAPPTLELATAEAVKRLTPREREVLRERFGVRDGE